MSLSATTAASLPYRLRRSPALKASRKHLGIIDTSSLRIRLALFTVRRAERRTVLRIIQAAVVAVALATAFGRNRS